MRNLLRRRESGQDLVEYALVLPIFLLLVMGILDLGRITYYFSALQNAAREGGRYGVVDPCTTAKIKFEVKDRAIALNLQDSNIQVSTYTDTPGNVKGCLKDKTLKLTVSYNFFPVTPLIGGFLGLANPDDSITITTSTTMRIEH